MLQITITEVNTNVDSNEEIEHTAEAIALIERAEEILDKLLRLGLFENDQSVENRLTEISTLLFTAQCNLSESVLYAELHS